MQQSNFSVNEVGKKKQHILIFLFETSVFGFNYNYFLVAACLIRLQFNLIKDTLLENYAVSFFFYTSHIFKIILKMNKKNKRLVD